MGTRIEASEAASISVIHIQPRTMMKIAPRFHFCRSLANHHRLFGWVDEIQWNLQKLGAHILERTHTHTQHTTHIPNSTQIQCLTS